MPMLQRHGLYGTRVYLDEAEVPEVHNIHIQHDSLVIEQFVTELAAAVAYASVEHGCHRMKVEIPDAERPIVISIEGQLQARLSLPASNAVTLSYRIVGDLSVE